MLCCLNNIMKQQPTEKKYKMKRKEYVMFVSLYKLRLEMQSLTWFWQWRESRNVTKLLTFKERIPLVNPSLKVGFCLIFYHRCLCRMKPSPFCLFIYNEQHSKTPFFAKFLKWKRNKNENTDRWIALSSSTYILFEYCPCVWICNSFSLF